MSPVPHWAAILVVLTTLGCGADGGGAAARYPLAGCVRTMTQVHSPQSPRDRYITTWDEHGRLSRKQLYYDPDGRLGRDSHDVGYHSTYRRDGTVARVVAIYSLWAGHPDLVETTTFDERGNPSELFRDINGDERFGPGDAIFRTENHYGPQGRLLRSVKTRSAVFTPRGRVDYRYHGGGRSPDWVFNDRPAPEDPESLTPNPLVRRMSPSGGHHGDRGPRWDTIPAPSRATRSNDEWGNLVEERSERWSSDGVGPHDGGPSVFVQRYFNTYGAPGVLAKVQTSWGSPGHSTPPSKRRTTFYDECGRPSRYRHDPEGDGVLGEWDVVSRYSYDCPCDPEAAR